MITTGDCVEVMAAMDAASVDAIVTDPPYGLEFMGKEWDRLGDRGQISHDGPKDRDPSNVFGRQRVSFYGSANRRCRACGHWEWSGSPCKCEQPDFETRQAPQSRIMQDWHQRWATEALRVAKPGAYLLAFGGTRTYHRLACAIEDAGWIIRDCLVWAYASGFPKSRANLKPAWEPIVMARKPGPLRELAIDASRIPGTPHPGGEHAVSIYGGNGNYEPGPNVPGSPLGRWPANVILTDPIFDGDVPGVVGGGEVKAGDGKDWSDGPVHGVDGVTAFVNQKPTGQHYGDTGTYSRFFLLPKAARSDREPNAYGRLEEVGEDFGSTVRNARCAICGKVKFAADDDRCHCSEPVWQASSKRRNVHPTVKPTELMRHLVRLVTPAGGTVLDPFLGSGTTAIAAEMEGFAWIGIEREPEYVAIAEARLAGVQKGLGLAS